MPHTLMKHLTEMKLTGRAAALSSQMDQPGTLTKNSPSGKDWRCWSRVNLSKGSNANRNVYYKKHV